MSEERRLAEMQAEIDRLKEGRANDRFEPNSTQYPDIILDDMTRYLDGSEFKIVSYFVRKTFGWGMKSDYSYHDSIMEWTGIKSRKTVVEKTADLVDVGLLIVVKPTHPMWLQQLDALILHHPKSTYYRSLRTKYEAGTANLPNAYALRMKKVR